MMSAEQFVKNRFPDAHVTLIAGGNFRLQGVPGLFGIAVSEAHVWQGAARELGDPVLEVYRERAAATTNLTHKG
jgi:hypothetical protein